MAVDKIEKTAHRFIKKWRNDAGALQELLERQDEDVKLLVIDILAREALAEIGDESDPDKVHAVLDAHCLQVKEYILFLLECQEASVESSFQNEDEPAQENVQMEYLAKAEPDLNDLRDKGLKQNAPSRGSFCPDKPLIAVSQPDGNPVRIVITRGDATVTIDL